MKEIRFKFSKGDCNTTNVDMSIILDGKICQKCESITDIEILGSRCPDYIIERIFKEAGERFKRYMYSLPTVNTEDKWVEK